MKYLVTFIVLFTSCGQQEPEIVDYIVSGNDTVVVTGAHIIDVSKVTGGTHGHHDTVNHIFYTIIK